LNNNSKIKRLWTRSLHFTNPLHGDFVCILRILLPTC
jgi:hypothetical protein